MKSDIGIRVTNLCYKINAREIISKLSCEILRGEFVVLLGPNGCGKSTFLNLLAKNLKPLSGTIEYLYPDFSFFKSLKLVTQNSADSLFMQMSIYDNYKVINHNLYKQHHMSKEHFAEYINKFNGNLSNKLDTPVSLLSGGEKQCLVLALMTCYDIDVLLLDEHTSALDPVAATNIMELTNKLVPELNISCILTTHDLEIAQNYGDKILVLGHGGNYRMIDKQEKELLTIEYMKQNFY